MCADSTDPAFLALWLTSLMAVLFALLFVWGSSDVSVQTFHRGRGGADAAASSWSSTSRSPSPVPPAHVDGAPHSHVHSAPSFSLPSEQHGSTSARRDGWGHPLLAVHLRMVGVGCKLRKHRRSREGRAMVGNQRNEAAGRLPLASGCVVCSPCLGPAAATRADCVCGRGKPSCARLSLTLSSRLVYSSITNRYLSSLHFC